MSDLVKRLRHADEYEPLGHDAWEAADRIEALEAALRFYTGIYEPGLSNPDEGPWGINSTDFGEVARKALDTA